MRGKRNKEKMIGEEQRENDRKGRKAKNGWWWREIN